MSKHLNIFALLILTCLGLYASEYKWSVHSSKSEAYVNEAIYLKYICEFSDRAELYSVEFNPVTDNEDYSLKLLSEEIKVVDGRKINSYEFVVFVKKAMDIELSFDALMKKTTEASIENTVLGRDNIDYEEFIKTAVKQESVKVEIKEIPTQLSGYLTLDIKKDEPSVKVYEPYHLDITVSGEGNFADIKELFYEIDGVKVFSQSPIQNINLTADGYVGSWNQKFAFVGSEDFRIPEQKIEYFDLKTQSVNVLKIDAIDVKVARGYQKTELLDDLEDDMKFDIAYLYYILTFAAGFLIGKVKLKRKKSSPKNEVLKNKIQAVDSLEGLSVLLILNNQKKFHDILTAIDEKELMSLVKAKKQAIQLIDG